MASSKLPVAQEAPSIAAIIVQAEQDPTITDKATKKVYSIILPVLPKDLVQTVDEAKHWYDLTKSQWSLA